MFGAPNPAAQVAFTSHPVLANWLILMSEDWIRYGFQAGCGLPLALVVWWIGENTALKHWPKLAKKFIPSLAVFIGAPLAAVCATYIPGLDAKEAAMCIIGIGGGGSHVIHDTAKAASKWRAERSGVLPPKDPPGSPGDG